MSDKRQERLSKRRSIIESNPVHKRIVWVRETLKLTQAQVSSDIGMSHSTYWERENGRRTELYEELFLLSHYFNSKWKEKYKQSYPSYDGHEVEEITMPWLIIGEDATLENAKRLIEIIQADYKLKEVELAEENIDLKNQLELFKGYR